MFGGICEELWASQFHSFTVSQALRGVGGEGVGGWIYLYFRGAAEGAVWRWRRR